MCKRRDRQQLQQCHRHPEAASHVLPYAQTISSNTATWNAPVLTKHTLVVKIQRLQHIQHIASRSEGFGEDTTLQMLVAWLACKDEKTAINKMAKGRSGALCTPELIRYLHKRYNHIIPTTTGALHTRWHCTCHFSITQVAPGYNSSSSSNSFSASFCRNEEQELIRE